MRRVAGKITSYELGELDQDDAVNLLGDLIESGEVYCLDRRRHRHVSSLFDAGICEFDD